MHTRTFSTLVLLAAILGLAGCAALGTVAKAVSEHDVIVRIAIAEYIGGQTDTAVRVIDLADEALMRLDGDPRVPIYELQAQADAMIPWHRMRPYQREIASELFFRVERRLVAAAEDGEVNPELLADLRHIITTARRTAQRELALAGA